MKIACIKWSYNISGLNTNINFVIGVIFTVVSEHLVSPVLHNHLLLVISNSILFMMYYFIVVPPSYGDIVLQDETLNLYISMAPDGVELNDYLFPVCGTYFSIHKNAITNVVSRQLGYATCYLEFPDVG